MQIVISAAADADYSAAFTYYKNISPQIGHRFSECFEAALDFIADYPLGNRDRGEGVRFQPFRGNFKNFLVYTVVDDIIEILAVAHFSRKPDYWRSKDRWVK